MPDTDQVQPTTIQKLQDAVAPAFALLAGMQLDLFSPMADAELTAEDLAVRLAVDANRLSRLLYALATAGLLTEREGSFRNGPEAAEFLVRGRPATWVARTSSSPRSGRRTFIRPSRSGPAARLPNTLDGSRPRKSTRPPSEAWLPWLWPSAGRSGSARPL